MRYKSIVASLALLATSLTAGAQTPDTLQDAGVRQRVLPLVTTKIRLVTRTYGDSIVLRWSAEDYVSWKYLANWGVNVLRVSHGSHGRQVDTLAYALKPLTLEQFQAKYPPSDSVALVPQGVLYGDAKNVKRERPGTMGRTLEDNSDQDMAFGFAMVVAEWRKDLAEDMAVRFTDRNVQPGMTYEYIVQPTRWENDGRLIFEPGIVENVENNPYDPEPFRPTVIDSLTASHSVKLGWWDSRHSSYEIERRLVSRLEKTLDNRLEPYDLTTEGLDDQMTQWQRVTSKPYVSMVEQPEGADYRLFVDSVSTLGVYEYRIMGYDAFADLSLPSEPRRVVVYDIDAPTPPQLKYIVVERPDDKDPMAKVIAHIVWEKSEIEDDLVGYCLYYGSGRSTGGEWQLMNQEMIPPQDTIYHADVTGLSTGMIYLKAYDDSGNESNSFPQQMRLTDYKAPAAPNSIKVQIVMPPADTTMTAKKEWAYAIITWQQAPEDDDIDYYDVAFANDSTHNFVIRNQGGIREQMFIDSLALDVNQKYIFYKVRAVDYSTNIGPWSPMLRVTRPHITPPTQPHLDKSSHTDQDGMHMEWVVGMDVDMTHHVLYRRLGERGDWQPIGRYDADSLVYHDYRIVVDDMPPYDREQRYYYHLESFNASPFTSKSLAVSWLHAGPKIWPVDIELAGDYINNEKETRLVWNVGKLPFDAPYYFCIYRKTAADSKFSFVISQPAEKTEYTDRLLRKGEKAEYYVMIQWRDGRQSTTSNTVTISRKE